MNRLILFACATLPAFLFTGCGDHPQKTAAPEPAVGPAPTAPAPVAPVPSPRSGAATVTASAQPARVSPGGQGTLTLTVAVAPGFHINAHKPKNPDLIPVDFVAGQAKGVVLGQAQYPSPQTIKVGAEDVLAYTGTTTISVPFTVAAGAKPGPATVGGTFSYQGCNDQICYPPKTVPIQATVTIQ